MAEGSSPDRPPFSFGHAQEVQALEEGPPTPPFLSAGGQRPGRHPTQEQGTAGKRAAQLESVDWKHPKSRRLI